MLYYLPVSQSYAHYNMYFTGRERQLDHKELIWQKKDFSDMFLSGRNFKKHIFDSPHTVIWFLFPYEM